MRNRLESWGLAAAGLIVAALAAIVGPLAPQAQQPGRAGDFDYYALVLSWSPTYCADVGAGRGDPQCSGRRPYAFVLHGLWPQYARGYPSDCRVSFNTFVPGPVADGILDIMPSKKLVFHEYRKHGTCSGLEPRAYFDTARKFYNHVKIPARFQALDAPITTSVAEIAQEFMTANPSMRREMLGVVCSRPNRVQEVRICFSKDGAFKTCGRNEDADRLCRAKSLIMPPTRGGTRDATRDNSSRGSSPRGPLPSPLPGPTQPERRI